MSADAQIAVENLLSALAQMRSGLEQALAGCVDAMGCAQATLAQMEADRTFGVTEFLTGQDEPERKPAFCDTTSLEMPAEARRRYPRAPLSTVPPPILPLGRMTGRF